MRFLRSVRRSAALVALIAAEGVAVVAVHRLGDHAPFDLPFNRLDPWLHAAPADALAAGLRAASLLCAWWLLLVTLLYVCACVSCLPSAVRACEWATPRAIRRTVDRALAASIVVGAMTAPFGARFVGRTVDGPRAGAPQHTVVVHVRDGRSRELVPADTAAPPAQGVPDPSPESAPAPSAPPDATGAAPISLPVDQSAVVVVVASGDTLWDLSATALARATARERATLGNDEIARYWKVVCAANHATVRSGDVNLIYPGEVIVLPSAP